jgi:hypothetical protein
MRALSRRRLVPACICFPSKSYHCARAHSTHRNSETIDCRANRVFESR